jgi:hypothetical protein
MVEFANKLTNEITRPIELVDMPVPPNRSDETYFAPLKRLAFRPKQDCVLSRPLHGRHKRRDGRLRKAEH